MLAHRHIYLQAHRHLHASGYTHKECEISTKMKEISLAAGTNKNLEESFVMLAGSASSLRHPISHAATSGISLQPLDMKFAQMARVFEIASEATQASMQACSFTDCKRPAAPCIHQ